jgi:hypothetical protein
MKKIITLLFATVVIAMVLLRIRKNTVAKKDVGPQDPHYPT